MISGIIMQCDLKPGRYGARRPTGSLFGNGAPAHLPAGDTGHCRVKEAISFFTQ